MRFATLLTLIVLSYSGIAQQYTPSFSPPAGPKMQFNPNRTPSTPLENNSMRREMTILYKDSTKETVRAKIDMYQGRYFLDIKDKTMAIAPAQTLKLTVVGEYERIFIGIPTDSCWLFKIVSGHINLYSVL